MRVFLYPVSNDEDHVDVVLNGSAFGGVFVEKNISQEAAGDNYLTIPFSWFVESSMNSRCF